MPRTFTRALFACPACDQGEHHCDHLKAGQSWGPWYCDFCGVAFDGRVDSGGLPAEVRILEGKAKQRTLVLLRLDRAMSGDPIFLVVKGYCFDGRTIGENNQYFYDEHTCPTNYLGVEAIIEGSNEDPHGIFKWVATVPLPEGHDDVDQHFFDDWCKLFPQLLGDGAKVIDGQLLRPMLEARES